MLTSGARHRTRAYALGYCVQDKSGNSSHGPFVFLPPQCTDSESDACVWKGIKHMHRAAAGEPEQKLKSDKLPGDETPLPRLETVTLGIFWFVPFVRQLFTVQRCTCGGARRPISTESIFPREPEFVSAAPCDSRSSRLRGALQALI
jgi:hypothetical protein